MVSHSLFVSQRVKTMKLAVKLCLLLTSIASSLFAACSESSAGAQILQLVINL